MNLETKPCAVACIPLDGRLMALTASSSILLIGYRERHSTSGAKSVPGDARVLAELAVSTPGWPTV